MLMVCHFHNDHSFRGGTGNRHGYIDDYHPYCEINKTAKDSMLDTDCRFTLTEKNQQTESNHKIQNGVKK